MANRTARSRPGVAGVTQSEPTSEWLPEILRAWAYWEALRRLGFSADDIYVGIVRGVVAGGTADCVCVQLQAQASTFTIIVALWANRDRAEWIDLWTKFCLKLSASGGCADDPWFSGFGKKELEAMWRDTTALMTADNMGVEGLPLALVSKGFSLPVVNGKKN